MKNSSLSSLTMRELHRYLGFFLVGIMSVYAISGVVLIFRDTDFLKKEKDISKEISLNANPQELGTLLGIKGYKFIKTDGNISYFENGQYDASNGIARYKVKELPFIMDKMTHLHKAKSTDPLYFFNIFFGFSLLFFVISSFWMFLPSTSIFKKGMYFTLAGIILTLILLFI
jgi:hypothetical protein